MQFGSMVSIVVQGQFWIATGIRVGNVVVIN